MCIGDARPEGEDTDKKRSRTGEVNGAYRKGSENRTGVKV